MHAGNPQIKPEKARYKNSMCPYFARNPQIRSEKESKNSGGF